MFGCSEVLAVVAMLAACAAIQSSYTTHCIGQVSTPSQHAHVLNEKGIRNNIYVVDSRYVYLFLHCQAEVLFKKLGIVAARKRAVFPNTISLQYNIQYMNDAATTLPTSLWIVFMTHV